MREILKLMDTIIVMVGTFFQTVFLSAEVIADKLKKRGDKELKHIKRMLIVIAVGPSAWFAVGILISCLGFAMDWMGLISFGRKVTALSGIMFAVAALYLWLRMYVLAQLLVLASYAVSKIPIPRLQDTGPSPGFYAQNREGVVSGGLTAGTHIWWDHADVAIKTEDMMKHLRIIMGLMFWITFVVIYACVFPVYANLLYFMLVLLAGLALGFATVYWKIDTPWLKRLSLVFIVLVIAFASLNFSQSVTATKSLEHHERMQKIYQSHHNMASQDMNDILKANGLLKAEKDPLYRKKQRTLALLENRMGMKGRLFAYLKRHAITAPDEWNDLTDQFGSGNKQTVQAKALAKSVTLFVPSPSAQVAPVATLPAVPLASAVAPAPAPSAPVKPQISSAGKAQLQALLKGMDEDKKKRKKIRQQLKNMNL